jgi:oxaloacetate decarboxylase
MSAAIRRELRSILTGGECLVPASVFDPISIRLAADAGFRLALLAGSVASLSLLGAPDIVLITLTEFADLATRIARAGAIPLLVDADHGYGNALNVARCVAELERAGVAGILLEDTDLPAPYGAARPALLPREEGLGKVRAALVARRDPDLVIVGRTAAASIAGVEEAVARAQNYEDAGVDALFFSGVQDLATLDAIRAKTTLPIILAFAQFAAPEALAERGVRIGLHGHPPIMAAYEAVRATYAAQRTGAELPKRIGAETLARLTGEAGFKGMAREYLAT